MHKNVFPPILLCFALFIASGCSPALKECAIVGRYSSVDSISFATHRSTLILIGGNIYTCPCDVARGREIAGITEARNQGGDVEARMTGGEVEVRKHAGDSLGRMTGGAVEARRTGGATEARMSGGDTEARQGGGAAERRAVDAVAEGRSFGGLDQKVMCYRPASCSGFALSGITGPIKYFNGTEMSSTSGDMCINTEKQ